MKAVRELGELAQDLGKPQFGVCTDCRHLGGDNFTEIIVLPVFADASGTAEINLTFPTFITPLWTRWQAVTFDPTSITLPIETSNATTVLVF